MSTRHLKWLTSGLIAAGVLLIAGWPWLVGLPPKAGTIAQRKAWVLRGLVGSGVLSATVIGAGVGAFFLMRRARDEYREESMRNMRFLLEGARADQLRKQPPVGNPVDEVDPD